VKTGVIKQLKGNPKSGLAELVFADNSVVYLEMFGTRKLFDAVDGLKQPITINYETDDLNIMTSFEVEGL
jgi:hypothetical protein